MSDVTDEVSWYRRAAALMIVAAVIIMGATPTWAADPEERLRDAVDNRDQAAVELNHSSQALADATAAYDAAMSQLPAAEAALAAADAALATAREQLAVAQGELAAAKAADAAAAEKLAEAEQRVQEQLAKIDEVTARIDGKRESISHVVVEAYQQGAGGQLATLAAALEADSLQELASGISAARSVVDAESSILSDLQTDRARLANERVVLDDLRDEAEQLRIEAAQKLDETEAMEAAARAAEGQAEQAATAAAEAKATVDGLVADRETAMSAAEAAKEADEREYAAWESERKAIQAEIDRIAREQRVREARERAARDSQRSAPAPAPEAPPSTGGGSGGGGGSTSRGLAFPVSNPYVTSPYGMRVHPITGVYKLHDGTDFRARCGTPIRASHDGRVSWASYRGAYGNQVAVAGGRYVTTYSHLSRFAVRSGESVSRGETIGYSGTTGSSTACHLHFMLYVNGSLTNPMNYL